MIAMLCTALPLAAQPEVERKLAELDIELGRKKEYVQAKRAEIEVLRKGFGNATADSALYAAARALYKAYIVFDSDSALHYARLCRTIAERGGDADRITDADIREAYTLTATGDFTRAEAVMRNIESRPMPTGLLLARLYEAQCFLYQRQAEFLRKGEQVREYKEKHMELLRRLLDIYPDSSYNHYVTKASMAIVQSRPDTSTYKAMLTYCDRFTFDNRDAAIWAILAADLARLSGDKTAETELLCLSAQADLRSANREVTALQYLAGIMYSRGDIERAYRYINSCTEDASIFNNRLRRMQITALQDSIHTAYDLALQSRGRDTGEHTLRLVLATAVIVLLLIALLYYARRNRALALRLHEAEAASAAQAAEIERLKETPSPQE